MRSSLVAMWMGGLGLLGGVELVSGCIPPPMNPGYVSTRPRRKGALDFNFQVGASLPMTAMGGSFHVEPYLNERLSVPIDFGVGFPTVSQIRSGIRYRVKDWLAVGGGAGLALVLFASSDDLPSAWGQLDVEVACNWRWKWFGLSWALRPAISTGNTLDREFAFVPWFHVLTEVALAFYVAKAHAISFNFGGYGFVGHDGDILYASGSAMFGFGYVYHRF